MNTLTAPGPTTLAASSAEHALAAAAPDLVPAFKACLPHAADVVSRRLLGAAYREGLLDARRPLAKADRHAFGRLEIAEPIDADPALLLGRVADCSGTVAVELTDAVVNLAVAYARRARIEADIAAHAAKIGASDIFDVAAGFVPALDADAQCVFFERLATEGHNLHPCARTRLGWDVRDVLAHDLESPHTHVGIVGLRRDLHVGHDLGTLAPDLVPQSTLDPARYAFAPVHAWQLARIVRARYADLVADRALVPLDEVDISAVPTAALRTLLLPPDRNGDGRYLKLSLDIQVTSTRRTISVASTRNGPALSALLGRLLADDDSGTRVVLMAETAGSAAVASGGRERDLAAIVRRGLRRRLAPGESAVPGSALYAISPISGSTILAELVNRFARTRRDEGHPFADRPSAALGFIDEYARILLPPVLTLATRHGIGLEAHLQNCVPIFVDGVPRRMALRDFAGLRLYPPRLGHSLDLWPGSVIVTHDVDVMRAKIAYTALQAHLGELVVRLVGSHSLDERSAWSAVRTVVDEVYDGLLSDASERISRSGNGNAVAGRARADHAFLTMATVPHKALLRMRCSPTAGDIYVPVENPLR